MYYFSGLVSDHHLTLFPQRVEKEYNKNKWTCFHQFSIQFDDNSNSISIDIVPEAESEDEGRWIVSPVMENENEVS